MYLGQYRQGDEIYVPLRAYTATPAVGTFPFGESNPSVRVFKTGTTYELVAAAVDMAAYDHPSFPGFFRLPIFLGDSYATTGSYTLELTWKSETAPYAAITRYCPFEILPGGDSDGLITSMAEVVRPDKRFIMCGTTAGHILRRKNPRVAS